MEKRIIESLAQLKNFISIHKLKNRNSLIHFHAKAFISTAQVTKQEEEIAVRVSFNIFGKAGELSFHDDDLDPNFYPTIFYPDYDDFLHIGEEFLEIKGFHSRNASIGKYIIEIYPLGKVKK
jgi:hypothetical protein